MEYSARRDRSSSASAGEFTTEGEDDLSFFSGEEEIIHTGNGRRPRLRSSSDAIPLTLPERKFHQQKWSTRLLRWLSDHKKGIFLTVVCFMLFVVFIYLSQDEIFLNDDEGSVVEPPPVVIATWAMVEPINTAWHILANDGPSMDAVEKGINLCEMTPSICNFTVGYGSSPDELGNVTLDAMVMRGFDSFAGAVGDLRRVKPAIMVARKVMEETYHTLLVGEGATSFAIQMGFPESSLSTPATDAQWKQWVSNGKVPNFWRDPSNVNVTGGEQNHNDDLDFDPNDYINEWVHDTIGLIAIDKDKNVSCGSSSSGLPFKIPGRVGHSAIVGAGAYCVNDVGAAAATGNGDVLQKFMVTQRAIEAMRKGKLPKQACHHALKQVYKHFPTTKAAVICMNNAGEYGATAIGYSAFYYTVMNKHFPQAQVVKIGPTKYT